MPSSGCWLPVAAVVADNDDDVVRFSKPRSGSRSPDVDVDCGMVLCDKASSRSVELKAADDVVVTTFPTLSNASGCRGLVCEINDKLGAALTNGAVVTTAADICRNVLSLLAICTGKHCMAVIHDTKSHQNKINSYNQTWNRFMIPF